LLGPRALPVGQHLPGLDPDPELERRPTLGGQLRAELRHRLLHLERGADSALGIVLVDGRHAEDGEHRVAGELLHEALVSLDLRAEPIERPADDRLDDLRVVALVQARVADEVGEQEGRDLALALLRRWRRRGAGFGDRRAARRAEASPRRELSAALSAGRPRDRNSAARAKPRPRFDGGAAAPALHGAQCASPSVRRRPLRRSCRSCDIG
jgi:hypothetical protein